MSDSSGADGEAEAETEGAAGGPPDEPAEPPAEAEGDADGSGGDSGEDSDADLDALRREVEEKYDFENFGPREMAEMSQQEWEAAFDPETWITGDELLDRVEADVKNRVASRDIFARVERFDDLLIAYSDNGYAAVYPDGSVEGRGTVLRDVKPVVALCSMDSYEVPDAPEEEVLPTPQEVPESSDALGNTVLQVVAGAQVLAGVGLFLASLLYGFGIISQPGATSQFSNPALLFVAALGFLVIGVALFAVVANARLSDKYRAEEFRNRLRAVGLEDGERPDFLDELSGVEGELPEELVREDGGEAGDGPDQSGGRPGSDGPAAGGPSDGPPSDDRTADDRATDDQPAG
jgi:hypothetical protein